MMPSLRRSCISITVLLVGPGFFLACSGGRSTGDRAGTVNWTMTITPGTPSVAVGQTLQLSATTPWTNETQWSVVPASAGSITSSGLFTASGTPGTAIVFAVWSKDVRYTASASLTILPLATPAESNPSLTQASGMQQSMGGTGIANLAVAGEAVQASTATTANGAIKVRHGFSPPAK